MYCTNEIKFKRIIFRYCYICMLIPQTTGISLVNIENDKESSLLIFSHHRICVSYVQCGTIYMGQHRRCWYLLHMQTANAQMSLRISSVSPQPQRHIYIKYGSG